VAVAYDLLAVNIQRRSANPPPFQSRSTHASPDALVYRANQHFLAIDRKTCLTA